MAIRTVKLKAGLDIAYPETSASLTKTSRGNVADDLNSLFAKANLYKGIFETELALKTAYPTADAGSYATVEATDTFWIWDNDLEEWKDSFNQPAPVTSVNGKDGAVVLSGGDINSTINVDGEESTQTLTQHLQAHQTFIEEIPQPITKIEIGSLSNLWEQAKLVTETGLYLLQVGDYTFLFDVISYSGGSQIYQTIRDAYITGGNISYQPGSNLWREFNGSSWGINWFVRESDKPADNYSGLTSQYVIDYWRERNWSINTDGTTTQVNASNQLEVKPFVENLPLTNKENTYLNANLQFQEIAIGSGGYAANLYPTNLVSTIEPTYYQLSYSFLPTETEVATLVNNNEVLAATYLFESPLGVTTIDAGAWNLTGRVKVSSVTPAGTSILRLEFFVKSDVGVETTLFSMNSTNITNTSYVTAKFESIQPSFSVLETDKLGVRIYASTTRTQNTTITYAIDDGFASYFNTPLALRHNQIRARDEINSHPSSAISYDNSTSGLTATTSQAAIDELAGLVDGIEALLEAI